MRNHAKFGENSTLLFTAVQGHPRSSILVSIESPYGTSSYSLIVTLAVSGTVFEILTLKAIENGWFYHPPLFEAPYLPNPCEYLHNPYIARNYIHQATFPLLTVWVYLHSCSCCSLPNTWNHAKFRENSTLQQFMVIQGHRSWCQSKAHMWLPINILLQCFDTVGWAAGRASGL